MFGGFDTYYLSRESGCIIGGSDHYEVSRLDSLFGALIGAQALVVCAVVVGVVGWDIYQHPGDPNPVGVAKVEISGTGHFRGDVGTGGHTYTFSGKAPATVKVPFRRADYVTAVMKQSPGMVRIKAKHETVDEDPKVVMWDVPRNFHPLPPKTKSP